MLRLFDCAQDTQSCDQEGHCGSQKPITVVNLGYRRSRGDAMEGGAELSRVSNDCYWQLCVISHTKKPGTGQALSLNLDGAQRRNRTTDTGIFSPHSAEFNCLKYLLKQ